MKYLFYVQYALSGLIVYYCETTDPFHVMGEMNYRTIEQIERISFTEFTPISLKYLSDNCISLYKWVNKHPPTA